MNLKEQQYIVTLAGCVSMTQAAKKLNITQPALSSYLAGVENGLGYPLFERTGKALRPTYLGELYLEKARKILALGEEFQHQREQVLHGYQGRIRVGIPIRRSPHLIPSALKIFRGRFPNVEVIVQEGNQRAMTEMLREDQLDLMLCNLVNQEGELEYEHLCWDPVIFWSRARIPAAVMPGTGIHFTTPGSICGSLSRRFLFCSTRDKACASTPTGCWRRRGCLPRGSPGSGTSRLRPRWLPTGLGSPSVWRAISGT